MKSTQPHKGNKNNAVSTEARPSSTMAYLLDSNSRNTEVKALNSRVIEAEKSVDNSIVEIGELILELIEVIENKEEIKEKYSIIIDKHKSLLEEKEEKEKD